MTRYLILLMIAMTSFLPAGRSQVRDLIEKAGTTEDYPGSHNLIIFDSTDVNVQPSGLSYVNMHKLVKVLTPSGAKENAVITVGYDPQSAYVEIRKATVYRADGRTHELDISEVLDYPAPARAIYWGAREKMLEVGRLEPGDALEIYMFRKGFTYALLYDEEDEKYIPPMRGHFYDIVEFWSRDHTLEKVYRVYMPSDKFLQYEFYHGDVRSSLVKRGDEHIYTFTKTDFSQPEREPNMVAPSDEFPKLLLSTSPDWNAKSLWFYGVNEDYGSFDVTPEVQEKVDELLANAGDEMDSVSVLTHWVADNIRYSGISMGEGEGYTLHKGEMTYADRCGVCKDKAGMLVTMLRAAGFESYPAMTMAGSRIDYIPADQFNHSVTVVKLSDGEYHLLDPTWVPFVRELWSSLEQQQNYLLGVPEGADLMITPVSPPENHYFRLSGNSELAPDGTLTGTLTLDAEGQSDAAIRRMFTGNFISEWEDALSQQILREHPRAVITSMDFGEPYEYLEGPLHIELEYTIPGYAVVTEDEIIMTPMALSGIFRRAMPHLYINTDLKERKYAFRDRCSRQVELDETVVLPFAADLVYSPETNLTSGEAASFKGGYSTDGNKLIATGSLKLYKRIYEPGDWGSFREAVVYHKNMANNPVILRKK